MIYHKILSILLPFDNEVAWCSYCTTITNKTQGLLKPTFYDDRVFRRCYHVRAFKPIFYLQISSHFFVFIINLKVLFAQNRLEASNS